MNARFLLIQFLVLIAMFHYETSLASEVAVTQGASIKQSLKSSSREERTEAISRAEVVDKRMDQLHRNSPEKISEIDMIQELNQTCGGIANYSNKNFDDIDWAKVNCRYHQDNNSLGGANKKFYCDFNEINHKGEAVIKKRKVKYSSFWGIHRSELVATILASTATRMLGFYTESYCPAVVKCENCSSDDPWKDHSSAPPSNKTHKFNYAIIEKPVDLAKIESSANNVSGFHWNEMMNLQDTPEKSAREKAIEREALLLWVNFLADTDAFPFNQRISCKKASVNVGRAYCEEPVIYDHDYGHAFYYRFKFDNWKSHVPLFEAENGTCRGGLTNKLLKSQRGKTQEGIHVSPIISAEARDFLVTRMSRITKKQWIDMLRISNANGIYQVEPEEFADEVMKKIESMERVRCAPFDSGTSVLSAK